LEYLCDLIDVGLLGDEVVSFYGAVDVDLSEDVVEEL
jgi:hypothetical protein